GWGGVVMAMWGVAAPFGVTALTPVGVSAALGWWHPQDDGGARRLPPERFPRARGAGLRPARHNPHLRATLIRAAGFFIFASTYWALLPLVARNQGAGGPALYGVFVGGVGAG